MQRSKSNTVLKKAIGVVVVLVLGVLLGLFTVPAAIKAAVRREALGFFNSSGANQAFQTFTEGSYQRLMQDGAPEWAKGYFDQGVIRSVKNVVDRGWDERLRLLRSGDPSASALASYWKSMGILDELGLPGAPGQRVGVTAATLPSTSASARPRAPGPRWSPPPSGSFSWDQDVR